MVKRGEVWWADLRPPLASEPGFRRPVVILQGNAYNASALSTTVVAVLTSRLERARRPHHPKLSRRWTKLPKDSVLLPTQILTIDKRVLAERVTKLPNHVLSQVEAALRSVLEL